MSGRQSKPAAAEWGQLAIFTLLLAPLLAVTGWFYFDHHRTESRRTIDATLETIADLKSEQIGNWLHERRSGAEIFYQDPHIEKFMSEPDNAVTRAEVLNRMATSQRHYNYAALVLFDADGTPRLKAPADAPMVCPHIAAHVQASLRARGVQFADLHRHAPDQPVFLSFLVPVGIKPQPDQPADGVLLLIIDPARFLYPHIQNWPTPSRSAETLLFRQEGDDVLYLNELRHKSNTALNLRLSIAAYPDLLAVKALHENTGVMTGVDYRGVPALGVTRKIAGTPWIIVAKVDQAEVFAPFRMEAWIMAAVMTLILLVILLFVALQSRNQKLIHSRREIADRQRSESQIRHLNAELEIRVRERTGKLEAANKELEAFSYSVSHDLRAPLRAVDGYSSILAEDFGERLGDEGRRVLNVIASETKRMGELIDDLLAFSRLSRQCVESLTVDMTALAREAFENQMRQHPERHVQWKCQPLPTVVGDPSMLRIVWVNLLSNALKFSRPRDPAVIEAGVCQQEGQTVYFVRDNGVGFDMQYVDKLFGVFQRLHSADEFEGTGIGLALVHRIILRHGGSIRAESGPDGGATFYFSLPQPKGKA